MSKDLKFSLGMLLGVFCFILVTGAINVTIKILTTKSPEQIAKEECIQMVKQIGVMPASIIIDGSTYNCQISK